MKLSFHRAIVFSIVLALTLSSQALSDKSKKKELLNSGTPVLWQETEDIASRNLYAGPGGEEMKPDLSKITFIEEVKGGYSTKYRVRDGSGREWIAKVSKEAQSETAAARLLWAVGYFTEINYLVPSVSIGDKGTFENVRFEARPDNIKRVGEWKWEDNPFVGTREFQGLKVLMVLLNNWDIKDTNNEILAASDPQAEKNQLRYIISDLGATFGKTGSLPVVWRITRSRNNPEDYSEARFIEGIKDNRVDFKFTGKKKHIFDDITVEQARWMGGLLSRLSVEQIKDAFRAANYTNEEVEILSEAVRARINELVGLPQQVD